MHLLHLASELTSLVFQQRQGEEQLYFCGIACSAALNSTLSILSMSIHQLVGVAGGNAPSSLIKITN